MGLNLSAPRVTQTGPKITLTDGWRIRSKMGTKIQIKMHITVRTKLKKILWHNRNEGLTSSVKGKENANIHANKHQNELSSNLDYLDLKYPDFSIIRTCFSDPSFLWVFVIVIIIFVSAAKFFSFKLPTEIVSLQSTNLYAFHATTKRVYFTELWLAQICSIAEWNFTFFYLSYSNLFLAH